MRIDSLRRIRSGAAVTALVLSGVFASSANAQQAKTEDVEAGPIWNQQDANSKCPAAATKFGGVWNGQWRTTVPGKMSVCGVTYYWKDVEAGPIWNQADANTKCPAASKKAGGVWNGQWSTTVPGKMSVCGTRFPKPPHG